MMPERPRLYVVVSCDCDPDRPAYGGRRYDSREPLIWRGIEVGIPALLGALAELGDEPDGNGPKITWAVRSDLQIEELEGDCGQAFRRSESLWRRLEAEGHEIGWHCHLWRWDDQYSHWYQETRDQDWMGECMTRGHHALTAAMGCSPKALRMGWEFHCNTSMRTAAGLGVVVDLSTAPGRHMRGSTSRDGTGHHKELDWRGSPAEPYRPSVQDYRRPAADGDTGLPILCIPKDTRVPLAWRVAACTASALRAARRREWDRVWSGDVWRGVLAAPAVTMPPPVFRRAARQRIAEAAAGGCALLHTAFHADELLPAPGTQGRFYSLSNFVTNVRELLEAAAGRVDVRFVRATDAARQVARAGA
jgi:hypothetical protein